MENIKKKKNWMTSAVLHYLNKYKQDNYKNNCQERNTLLEKNMSKIKQNIWEENIKQLEASRVEIEAESEVATILMQTNN